MTRNPERRALMLEVNRRLLGVVGRYARSRRPSLLRKDRFVHAGDPLSLALWVRNHPFAQLTLHLTEVNLNC